jgi:hypothetical protein
MIIIDLLIAFLKYLFCVFLRTVTVVVFIVIVFKIFLIFILGLILASPSFIFLTVNMKDAFAKNPLSRWSQGAISRLMTNSPL